jgi:hypothetical protein
MGEVGDLPRVGVPIVYALTRYTWGARHSAGHQRGALPQGSRGGAKRAHFTRLAIRSAEARLAGGNDERSG